MNKEILAEIIEESNFLHPYLKQFSNNFKEGASIGEIGRLNDNYLNYLENLGLDISPKEKYDGLIIVNTHLYEDNIEKLFIEIKELIKETGYLFFVIRNKKNLLERIEYHLLTEYQLVQEYIGDDHWKFLLYQKSTIK